MSLNYVNKTFTMKTFKKVTFTFDPFHVKTSSGRHFIKQCYSMKDDPARGNPNVVIDVKVVDDRRNPELALELSNGEKLVLDTSKMNNNRLMEYLHWSTIAGRFAGVAQEDRLEFQVKLADNYKHQQKLVEDAKINYAADLAKRDAWRKKNFSRFQMNFDHHL